MPEWWLLIIGLAGLTTLAFAWKPFIVALPFLAVALGLVLVQNALSVRRAAIAGGLGSDRHCLKLKAVTLLLHLLQPLARLYGRLRCGLIAWRRRVPKKRAFPLPR